jgi:hypothetical protein
MQVLLGLLYERRQLGDGHTDIGRPRLGLGVQGHDRPVSDFTGSPDLRQDAWER